MDGVSNGYEYLKRLQEESEGDHRATFRDYAGYLEQRARETATPLSGQFELTPLCNLDCKMCYVHLKKDQMQEQSMMSVDQWKRLMGQAAEMGMMTATLTGGECLTYPGFDDLYLYLQGMGCNVSVLTNGLMLDEKRIQFFKAHWPDGIQVTLYGGDDEAYERVTGQRVFGMVRDHVKMAIEAGLPVTLALTPNRYLGDGLLDAVRFACSLSPKVQINDLLFSPREETGRSGQEDDAGLETYIRAFRLLYELQGRAAPVPPTGSLPEPGGPCRQCDECGVECGGGRSKFTITWQGKMVPCNRLDVIESAPLTDGFRKAWQQINHAAVNWPRVPQCQGCPYEPICAPCAGNLLRFTVPGKLPEKLCHRVITYVRNGIRQLPDCE